jgi:ubiquinone/menaquinone biosynthesis C-methylase UbiE
MAERVCPPWMGYWLANPLRKLFQNPRKILDDHVKPGMTVLDIGCAMGFFSLGMAKIVGDKGKVIAVDLQEEMIEGLKKRAKRAGLSGRIETRICTADSLQLADLAGQIDFVLAFYVVHEVPNPTALFTEIYQALKSGGILYVVEPKGHVIEAGYKEMVAIAQSCGFKISSTRKPPFERATFFEKP